jgi:hypothetical protein
LEAKIKIAKALDDFGVDCKFSVTQCACMHPLTASRH